MKNKNKLRHPAIIAHIATYNNITVATLNEFAKIMFGKIAAALTNQQIDEVLIELKIQK